MSNIQLSVLDQSLLHGDWDNAKALQSSIALAKECEKLSYKRYWIAEHHDESG